MKRLHWAIGGIMALMLFCPAAGSPAAEEKAPNG